MTGLQHNSVITALVFVCKHRVAVIHVPEVAHCTWITGTSPMMTERGNMT